ncbi:DnaJ-domain-containing protein [Massarina eburnea CBS 473.64]|uniref:DnaJ-domain-containing protein n=1 Tax=Massarina eburnea CBS 473.64 TaxID=1395130 RepID=A0A6A6S3C9_9PLEO|nr:DnaJ-domain-containing protein [Massarina eburnea CBS 473.64]
MSTHYKALGVQVDCSLEEIKAAYKRIQLRHHPDKTGRLTPCQRTRSEAISKAANIAYEVLADADARRKYNQSLPGTKQSSGNTHDTASNNERKSSRKEPKTECGDSGYRYNAEYASREENWVPPPRPAPPQIYPNTLLYQSVRWEFFIELNARFDCCLWGTNYVWQEGETILIMAQLKETSSLRHGKDVEIAVTRSPDSRRIMKVESYFKHCVKDNIPETQLWIRLHAPSTGQRMCYNQPWTFAWDLTTSHCSPPPGITVYGTHLEFYHEKLDARLHDSNHTSHPEYDILKDRDMGEKDGIQIVDMGCDSSQSITFRNETMHRRAAFGYQRGCAKVNVEKPPPTPEPYRMGRTPVNEDSAQKYHPKYRRRTAERLTKNGGIRKPTPDGDRTLWWESPQHT